MILTVEAFGEKPFPVPLRPIIISHRMKYYRTQDLQWDKPTINHLSLAVSCIIAKIMDKSIIS